MNWQLRECWNRQTGTFEGRVSYGVRVQVPSLAPKIGKRPLGTCRFLLIHSSLFTLHSSHVAAKSASFRLHLGSPPIVLAGFRLQQSIQLRRAYGGSFHRVAAQPCALPASAPGGGRARFRFADDSNFRPASGGRQLFRFCSRRTQPHQERAKSAAAAASSRQGSTPAGSRGSGRSPSMAEAAESPAKKKTTMP